MKNAGGQRQDSTRRTKNAQRHTNRGLPAITTAERQRAFQAHRSDSNNGQPENKEGTSRVVHIVVGTLVEPKSIRKEKGRGRNTTIGTIPGHTVTAEKSHNDTGVRKRLIMEFRPM